MKHLHLRTQVGLPSPSRPNLRPDDGRWLFHPRPDSGQFPRRKPGKHRNSYHFFRQLDCWYFRDFKLMESNSNGCFPGCYWQKRSILWFVWFLLVVWVNDCVLTILIIFDVLLKKDKHANLTVSSLFLSMLSLYIRTKMTQTINNKTCACSNI